MIYLAQGLSLTCETECRFYLRVIQQINLLLSSLLPLSFDVLSRLESI